MATDPRIPTNATDIAVLQSRQNHMIDPALGLHSLRGGIYDADSDNLALVSGTVIFTRLPSPSEPKTISHIEAHVGQTASATVTDHRLGLYKTSGTNLVRLGVSGASTTLLATDEIAVAAALATPVIVNPADVLWAAVLSVATTAGTLVGKTLASIGAATAAPAATSHPIRAYTLAAQTALDATEAISGMTASYNIPWLFARYQV